MPRFFTFGVRLGVILLCWAWAAAAGAASPAGETPPRRAPRSAPLAMTAASPAPSGTSDGIRSVPIPSVGGPKDEFPESRRGQRPADGGGSGGVGLMGKTHGGTCSPRRPRPETVAVMAMGFAGMVGARFRWFPPSE